MMKLLRIFLITLLFAISVKADAEILEIILEGTQQYTFTFFPDPFGTPYSIKILIDTDLITGPPGETTFAGLMIPDYGVYNPIVSIQINGVEFLKPELSEFQFIQYYNYDPEYTLTDSFFEFLHVRIWQKEADGTIDQFQFNIGWDNNFFDDGPYTVQELFNFDLEQALAFPDTNLNIDYDMHGANRDYLLGTVNNFEVNFESTSVPIPYFMNLIFMVILIYSGNLISKSRLY